MKEISFLYEDGAVYVLEEGSEEEEKQVVGGGRRRTELSMCGTFAHPWRRDGNKHAILLFVFVPYIK
jgi:hypothetical protein